MLSVLALGMLIAVGAAVDGADYGGAWNDGQPHNGGDGHNNGGNYDHGDNHNFDGFNNHYDWLNTGGYYPYSFYQTYPYSYYPTYTYTYPTYTYPTYTYPTYTAPVVYNPYPYDPVAYIHGTQPMSMDGAERPTTTPAAGPGRLITADSSSKNRTNGPSVEMEKG